jgi:hypothetical protein
LCPFDVVLVRARRQMLLVSLRYRSIQSLDRPPERMSVLLT